MLGTNSSLRLLNLFPEKPFAVVALAVGPQRFSKTEKGVGQDMLDMVDVVDMVGWGKACRGWHLVVS